MNQDSVRDNGDDQDLGVGTVSEEISCRGPACDQSGDSASSCGRSTSFILGELVGKRADDSRGRRTNRYADRSPRALIGWVWRKEQPESRAKRLENNELLAEPGSNNLTPAGRGKRFATTNWSLVLAAADTQNPNSGEALEDLCRKYWPPVYAFIRYRGFDEAKAEDLTQGFFTRLLEKKNLKAADPERGKFRSFLLASVKHYLAPGFS